MSQEGSSGARSNGIFKKVFIFLGSVSLPKGFFYSSYLYFIVFITAGFSFFSYFSIKSVGSYFSDDVLSYFFSFFELDSYAYDETG